MPKKSLTISALAFLIFISLICQTTSATTYTFDSTNPAICDSYNVATDTCTITATHTYITGNVGDDITITFNNIVGSGAISVNGAGNYNDGGTITINAGTVDINSISADGSQAGDAGAVTINATTLRSTGISVNGGSAAAGTVGDAGAVTIKSDTVDIGSLNACGGHHAHGGGGAGGIISVTATHFSSFGTINANAGNSVNGGIGGTIDIKATDTINTTSSITSTRGHHTHGTDGSITLETCKIKTTNSIIGGNIRIRYCEELGGNNFIPVVGSASEDILSYDLSTCLALYNSQPTPTLLSLQGTVTDPDNNPINGTVNITSLEKCADTTCATKTTEDITAAANDITFTGGIVNSMVGPYDLIIGTTYTLTVKVCNLLGLCDTDIRIIFRG